MINAKAVEIGQSVLCHSNFALAYLPGAGRTCGEEVETTWSSSNHLHPSTCKMGPAACHEVLNDHWTDWNFQKSAALLVK
ncbi:hypothetical protein BDQ17DRAFT_1256830 [Cyathus striatus]|nr:hypothetical protein BDQ17DRAFT_1256830 [Cyathus striatus]